MKTAFWVVPSAATTNLFLSLFAVLRRDISSSVGIVVGMSTYVCTSWPQRIIQFRCVEWRVPDSFWIYLGISNPSVGQITMQIFGILPVTDFFSRFCIDTREHATNKKELCHLLASSLTTPHQILVLVKFYTLFEKVHQPCGATPMVQSGYIWNT